VLPRHAAPAAMNPVASEPTAVAPLAVHRPSHADAHNRNVDLYVTPNFIAGLGC